MSDYKKDEDPALAAARQRSQEIARFVKENRAAPNKGVGGHIRDLGLTALSGAVSVPELAVGLADIPTGGRVGKFLENEDGAFGFRPREAKEAIAGAKTARTQEQLRDFTDTEGFGGKVDYALSNPSLITNTVVESLPSMLAGGVIGRGLGLAAKGLSPVAAGALGEGAVGAGLAAESIRQQTDDGLLTGKQAGLAAATGATTAGFGYAGGKIAQKLGIGDVDTIIAGGGRTANPAANIAGSAAANAAKDKNIFRRAAEGALSEGVFEELPQSVSETILQNEALGTQGEGVADAAALGLLSGGLMGAGAGAFARNRRPDERITPTEDMGQESSNYGGSNNPKDPNFNPAGLLENKSAPQLGFQGRESNQFNAGPNGEVFTGDQYNEYLAGQQERARNERDAGQQPRSFDDVTQAPQGYNQFGQDPLLPAPNDYTVTPDGTVQSSADVNTTLQNERQARIENRDRRARGEVLDRTGTFNENGFGDFGNSEQVQAERLGLPAPESTDFTTDMDGQVYGRNDINEKLNQEREQAAARRDRIARGEILDRTPIPKLSEQMGLDANKGSLSSAAVLAVDSGASGVEGDNQVAAQEPQMSAWQSGMTDRLANADPNSEVYGRLSQAIANEPTSAPEKARLMREADELPRAEVAVNQIKPNTRVLDKAKAQTRAYTPDGAEIQAQWDVVDASELVTSNTDSFTINPNYPASRQPRDRTRASAQQQVNSIASKLQPNVLGESPDVSTGAPFVGANDNVVDSGNGRSMAIRKVYQENGSKAQEYRQFVNEQAAKFGLDTDAVNFMQSPVLVRRNTSDVNRDEFARAANKPTAARMSSTEQAASDAKNLPDASLLSFNADGNINLYQSQGYLKNFVSGLSETEQSAMMDENGGLSREGKSRIEAAIVQDAYNNPRLVAAISEKLDNDTTNVLRAVTDKAPQISQLNNDAKAGVAFNNTLGRDIADAAQAYMDIRNSGKDINTYLMQDSLLGDGLTDGAKEILTVLSDNKRSAKAIGEDLQNRLNAITGKGNPKQGGLSFDDEVETTTPNVMSDAPKPTQLTDENPTVNIPAPQPAPKTTADAMEQAESLDVSDKQMIRALQTDNSKVDYKAKLSLSPEQDLGMLIMSSGRVFDDTVVKSTGVKTVTIESTVDGKRSKHIYPYETISSAIDNAKSYAEKVEAAKTATHPTPKQTRPKVESTEPPVRDVPIGEWVDGMNKAIDSNLAKRKNGGAKTNLPDDTTEVSAGQTVKNRSVKDIAQSYEPNASRVSQLEEKLKGVQDVAKRAGFKINTSAKYYQEAYDDAVKMGSINPNKTYVSGRRSATADYSIAAAEAAGAIEFAKNDNVEDRKKRDLEREQADSVRKLKAQEEEGKAVEKKESEATEASLVKDTFGLSLDEIKNLVYKPYNKLESKAKRTKDVQDEKNADRALRKARQDVFDVEDAVIGYAKGDMDADEFLASKAGEISELADVVKPPQSPVVKAETAPETKKLKPESVDNSINETVVATSGSTEREAQRQTIKDIIKQMLAKYPDNDWDYSIRVFEISDKIRAALKIDDRKELQSIMTPAERKAFYYEIKGIDTTPSPYLQREFIGKNSDGKRLYEFGNGERYIHSEERGVGNIPEPKTGEREDRFKTVNEIADKPKPAAATIDSKASEDGNGKTLFSRASQMNQAMNNTKAGAMGSTQTTREQVITKLSERFGKETIQGLIDKGLLDIKVLSDFVVDGKLTIPSDVDGLYQNGKATLIADNLSDDMIIPTFLHELGGHGGMQTLMSDKAYAALMRDFDALVASGDPLAVEAKAMADKVARNEQDALDEYLPYLLTLTARQQGKQGKVAGMINRMAMAIRTWLRDTFGINLKVNAQDILGIAERMVNEVEQAANSSSQQAAPQFSGMNVPSKQLDDVRAEYEGTDEWMKAPNGEDTNLNEKQWLQVRTPAFKQWFGDWEGDAKNASKVVDTNGEPMVVYHGTQEDFTEFELHNQGFDPNPSDGYFFTDDQDAAEEYADYENVMPAFLNIREMFDFYNPNDIDVINTAIEDGDVNSPTHGEEPPLFNSNENAWDSIVDSVNRIAINDVLDGVIDWVTNEGYDGLLFSDGIRDSGYHKSYVATNPNQIKSATDNVGTFDGSNPDIRYSRAGAAGMNDQFDPRNIARESMTRFYDWISSAPPGKLSWWHKTIGTMYNLAQRNPHFKPVFDNTEKFINDVSFYASKASEFAPRLLPQLDSIRDITKSAIGAKDNDALSKPIFEGTLLWGRDLDGKAVLVEDWRKKVMAASKQDRLQMLKDTNNITPAQEAQLATLNNIQANRFINNLLDEEIVKAGLVWKDSELRAKFNLNDQQIELYREFRSATDNSLDSLTRSDMLRRLGKDAAAIETQVMEAGTLGEAVFNIEQHINDLIQASPKKENALKNTLKDIKQSAGRTNKLIDNGYAPLSRFGQYTVDVVDADGNREYFGMFESAYDARKMTEEMKALYNDPTTHTVTQGALSNEEFKMFAGVTPETAELFGEMLGLDATGDKAADEAFQEYLRRTKNNRSTMKRLIHRKGIKGYSEDVGRVLASFIYSNARHTSAALNMGNLDRSIADIPKGEGQLKDAAVKLAQYIKNPQEEGQLIRGWMFAQYLGGSVASAVVNLTQPIAVSFPYLSQFGGAVKAAAQLKQSSSDWAKSLKNRNNDHFEADLQKAIERAEADGTLSPQEVHNLLKQASGKNPLRAGDGTKIGNAKALAGNSLSRVSLAWGSLFSLAEQVNRRVTFVAAYRMAKEQGMDNPAKFATNSIKETQFVYNKASRMNWGRGAVGGTLMTFKTYTVSYMELMHRLWTQGDKGSEERNQGRKAVGIMIGTLFLLGGAGGLPFMEDAEDLVDGIGQIMGYNFSSKKVRQQFLDEWVGEFAGDFIDGGISSVSGSPTDVSGRLGLGNLIPGTGIFKERTSNSRDVLEIVGTAGDFVGRVATGTRDIAKGVANLDSTSLKKGALEFAPTAVRNAVKGTSMATSGIYKDTKGYKVADVTPVDAAFKFFGFQPRDISKIQEANYLGQSSTSYYNLRASSIRALWAAGVVEGNQSKVDDARDAVKDWNKKNPNQKIIIKPNDIARRVREMKMDKADRVIKLAPKSGRGTLAQELNGVRDGM